MADGTLRRGVVPLNPVFIYFLSDPRAGNARYVGATTQPPSMRLSAHIYAAKRGVTSQVAAWLRELRVASVRPLITVLECVPVGGDWEEAERRWISHYRAAGSDLLNQSIGGAGPDGVKHTDETKSAMRRYHNRADVRTERSERQRRIRTGKSLSVETKAKMSEAMARRRERGNVAGFRGARNPRAKAVIIDGARYETIGDAVSALSISRYKIDQRIKRGQASYAESESERSWDHGGIPVIVDGVRYDTYSQAASAFGVAVGSITYWVKTGRAHRADD